MGLAWRSGLHLQMFHHVFFLWLSVAHIGWNIMMVLVPKKNPRWWFQISFMFTPGERIQFDLSIFFQVGWFNHQLEAFSRNDRGSTSWSSSYCRHRCHSPRGDWLNKVAEDVIGAYDVFPGTSPGKTLEISIISLEHLPPKMWQEESRWKIMFDHFSSHEALSLYFARE